MIIGRSRAAWRWHRCHTQGPVHACASTPSLAATASAQVQRSTRSDQHAARLLLLLASSPSPQNIFEGHATFRRRGRSRCIQAVRLRRQCSRKLNRWRESGRGRRLRLHPPHPQITNQPTRRWSSMGTQGLGHHQSMQCTTTNLYHEAFTCIARIPLTIVLSHAYTHTHTHTC